MLVISMMSCKTNYRKFKIVRCLIWIVWHFLLRAFALKVRGSKFRPALASYFLQSSDRAPNIKVLILNSIPISSPHLVFHHLLKSSDTNNSNKWVENKI